MATLDLDPTQVSKAVAALLAYNQKTRGQLFAEDPECYVSLLVAFKTVPKAPSKPFHIPLKHSLYGSDDAQICLISKDPQEEYEALIKKAGLAEKVTVLSVSKLRSEHRQYEDRRKLCDMYDLFLADDRIMPVLPRLLGKSFYSKKKKPVAVVLNKPQRVAKEIEKARYTSLFHLGQGSLSSIKVGHTALKAAQIVDNIVSAVSAASDCLLHKSADILSLHIKTADSAALPIFTSLPEMPRAITLKRKADGEVEEEKGEEKTKTKAAKKAKKQAGEDKVKAGQGAAGVSKKAKQRARPDRLRKTLDLDGAQADVAAAGVDGADKAKGNGQTQSKAASAAANTATAKKLKALSSMVESLGSKASAAPTRIQVPAATLAAVRKQKPTTPAKKSAASPAPAAANAASTVPAAATATATTATASTSHGAAQGTPAEAAAKSAPSTPAAKAATPKTAPASAAGKKNATPAPSVAAAAAPSEAASGSKTPAQPKTPNTNLKKRKGGDQAEESAPASEQRKVSFSPDVLQRAVTKTPKSAAGKSKAAAAAAAAATAAVATTTEPAVSASPLPNASSFAAGAASSGKRGNPTPTKTPGSASKSPLASSWNTTAASSADAAEAAVPTTPSLVRTATPWSTSKGSKGNKTPAQAAASPAVAKVATPKNASAEPTAASASTPSAKKATTPVPAPKPSTPVPVTPAPASSSAAAAAAAAPSTRKGKSAKKSAEAGHENVAAATPKGSGKEGTAAPSSATARTPEEKKTTPVARSTRRQVALKRLQTPGSGGKTAGGSSASPTTPSIGSAVRRRGPAGK